MRRDVATRKGRRCLRVRPRHAMWLLLFLANLRQRDSDSGQFMLNRANSSRIGRFRPKFKKKKKKRCKTHHLNLILNPTSTHFTQTHQTSAFYLSLILSLVSHSLCALCLCSARCETLSQCRVSHLTHFSSFFLQLSLTHS